MPPLIRTNIASQMSWYYIAFRRYIHYKSFLISSSISNIQNYMDSTAYTAISVSDNRVVERKFMSTSGYPKGYMEKSDSIGKHLYGLDAVTIDTLYLTCSTYLKRNNTENFLTLSIMDSTGFIGSCGYTPNNCADDCFIGFSLM